MVIKALTGFGDYNVNSNSLMVPKLGGDPPIVRNTNGGFVVHHREYMADITASTSFNIKTIPINPGLLGSFPGFLRSQIHMNSMKCVDSYTSTNQCLQMQ